MRKFLVLIALVVLVAGGWAAGWVWAAGEVRNTVARLGAPDGATTPQLTCGRLDVSGFPFRLDLTCEAATVVAGDLTVTVAGIKASVLVYNPTQAVFSALAPVTLRDAYSGAESRIDFSGAEGSARLVSDDPLRGLSGAGWRIGRISTVADDLRWTDTLVGEVLALSAAHLEAHLLDVPERHDPAAGTAVLAAYASLSDVTAPGIAIDGGEASFEAELSGLPDDIRRLGDTDVLCRLRNNGGALRLVSLRGSAGADFVESSGTLTLDSAGRPEGQLELTSRGLVERLGGLLPEELKFLIGQQAADGSYAQTLNLKAGVMMAGLLPMPFVLAPLCG